MIKGGRAVGRTPGWITQHRRLVRDYEALTTNSRSMIRIAMINRLTKRAAEETVQSLPRNLGTASHATT